LRLRRWRAVVLIVVRAVEALTLCGRHVLRGRVVDVVPGLLLHLHRGLVLRVLWEMVLRRRMREELLLLLGRLRGLRVRVWRGHRLRLWNIGLRITGRWLIRAITRLSGRRRWHRRSRRVVMLRLLLLLLLLAPVVILSSVAVVGIKGALLCGRARRLGRSPLLIEGPYTRRLLDVRLPLLRGGRPVRRVIGLPWLGRRRAWRQRRLVRRRWNERILVVHVARRDSSKNIQRSEQRRYGRRGARPSKGRK